MSANIFIANESPFDAIGDKAGGAALVAFEQTKSFQDIDPSTNYWIISPARSDNKGQESGLNCLFFKKPSLIGPDLADFLTQPKYLEKFYPLFKDAKFNYAHYFVAGKILAALKDRLNSPFIFKAHTWDKIVCHYDTTRAPNLRRIAMESEVLKKSDLIIIATEAEKQDLAKIYQDDQISSEEILKKTFVASLGINQEKYNPANSEKFRKSSRAKFIPEKFHSAKVFFMLGRLVPEKRQLAVVQAFAQFLSKNNTANAVLSIFGGPLDGTYYQKIAAAVASLPPEIQERILFQGVQPSIEAISCGDIFVGPSSWESWYLALVEAMACGKPSITTDTAVLREVTKGQALYVDPQGSIVDSLAEKMAKLFFDASLYHDLELKSRSLSTAYDWLTSAELILKAIENLQKK